MSVRIDYLDQRNYAVTVDNATAGRIYRHHGTDWTVMVGARCKTVDSYKEAARLAPILAEHPHSACDFGLSKGYFAKPGELHDTCSCPQRETPCQPATP